MANKVNVDEIEVTFRDEDDGETKVITVKYDEDTKKKYYIDQTDFDVLELVTEIQLQIAKAEDEMMSEEDMQRRVLPLQVRLMKLQLGDKLLSDARRYFQSKGDKLSAKFISKAWEAAYIQQDEESPKED